MTGLEAWSIISADLAELYRLRDANMRHYVTGEQIGQPYSKSETEAEVICFMALKKMDEVNECGLMELDSRTHST